MENTCPHCEQHCPADNPRCPNGKEYFGTGSADEKAVVLLRKCGHFLHHSIGRGGDASHLMDALTETEKAELESLLEKCLNSWQSTSAPEQK